MTGRRRALVVANSAYDHEGLQHLRSPAADADALAEVLGDPAVGDFSVDVVHNEPSYEVQARVEDLFADSRPDDLVLLHFSCHGLKSESGELFFAARNTRPDRLGSTAVPADFVQRCMRSSRSRSIVLLLDCCYGGAFGQGVAVRAAGDVNVLDSFPGGRLGGGRGRAVITASSAMEYAFEGDHLADDRSREPSVFTGALVEGLRSGDADRDEDGWVSLNELYDYVFDRVRERNPNQTPSRDIEMQGELYVARSRRRRVVAAPVPAELAAAAADSNLYTRLGAVAELRSRVLADDVPVAMGAYELLADVARTDVRYVAEAAQAALREADLGVAVGAVAFGRVPQGATVERVAVPLGGPALARACSVETSDRRVLVEEVADGLRVGLDTTRTGVVEATVTLTGPTGRTVVAVTGEVVPAEEGHGEAGSTAGSATPGSVEKGRGVHAAADVGAGAAAATTPGLGTGGAPPPSSTGRSRPGPAAGPGAAEPGPPVTPPAAARAAESTGRSPQRLRRPGSVPVLAAVLVTAATGLASIVLGYRVLVERDQDAWEAAGFVLVVQLTIYAAFRLVQSAVEGGAGLRPVLLMTSGVLALVMAALAWSDLYERWPVTLFWLVDGVVAVVAAVKAPAVPRRALELPLGLAAAAIGGLGLVFIVQDWDAALSPVTGALGYWLIVLGVGLLVLARLGPVVRSSATEDGY
ncbi:MAG TPA: caspase family protein [Jiangellales bacterium]|nr:caspase family protein [Jiangellales bacterium]